MFGVGRHGSGVLPLPKRKNTMLCDLINLIRHGFILKPLRHAVLALSASRETASSTIFYTPENVAIIKREREREKEQF